MSEYTCDILYIANSELDPEIQNYVRMLITWGLTSLVTVTIIALVMWVI